ncbi:cora-like Mg2+ transporter protein-domain-containing protein [Pyronema omphalodes]|nr:cora-like Mg2+ transporter protein-domain-containing protein [Pyronema omphalodes]
MALKDFKLYHYQYEVARLRTAFGEDLNREIRSHATTLLNSVFAKFKDGNPRLVFVGNGMGGLIAKQALVFCGTNKPDNGIDIEQKPESAALNGMSNPEPITRIPDAFRFVNRHITSVIFIATPHRGWQTEAGDAYYTAAQDPEDDPDPLSDVNIQSDQDDTSSEISVVTKSGVHNAGSRRSLTSDYSSSDDGSPRQKMWQQKSRETQNERGYYDIFQPEEKSQTPTDGLRNYTSVDSVLNGELYDKTTMPSPWSPPDNQEASPKLSPSPTFVEEYDQAYNLIYAIPSLDDEEGEEGDVMIPKSTDGTQIICPSDNFIMPNPTEGSPIFTVVPKRLISESVLEDRGWEFEGKKDITIIHRGLSSSEIQDAIESSRAIREKRAPAGHSPDSSPRSVIERSKNMSKDPILVHPRSPVPRGLKNPSTWPKYNRRSKFATPGPSSLKKPELVSHASIGERFTKAFDKIVSAPDILPPPIPLHGIDVKGKSKAINDIPPLEYQESSEPRLSVPSPGITTDIALEEDSMKPHIAGDDIDNQSLKLSDGVSHEGPAPVSLTIEPHCIPGPSIQASDGEAPTVKLLENSSPENTLPETGLPVIESSATEPLNITSATNAAIPEREIYSIDNFDFGGREKTPNETIPLHGDALIVDKKSLSADSSDQKPALNARDNSLLASDSLPKSELASAETKNNTITVDSPWRTQAAEWSPGKFTPEILNNNRRASKEEPENPQEGATAASNPPTDKNTFIRPPRQVRFETNSSAESVTSQSCVDEPEIYYYVDQPLIRYQKNPRPMNIPSYRMYSDPPDRRQSRAGSRQRSSSFRFYTGRSTRGNSPTNSDNDYIEYQQYLRPYPSTSASSYYGGSRKASSRKGSYYDDAESRDGRYLQPYPSTSASSYYGGSRKVRSRKGSYYDDTESRDSRYLRPYPSTPASSYYGGSRKASSRKGSYYDDAESRDGRYLRPYPSTSASSYYGGTRKTRSRRDSYYDDTESTESVQPVRYRLRKVASQADLQKREAELRKGYEEIKSQLETAVKIRKWDPYHRAESAFLEKLRIDFEGVCNQYDILSVFSSDQLLDHDDTATSSRIVGKGTALLIVPTEEFLAMALRSHADLLRYDSREDNQYSLFEETITTFIEKARLKTIRTDANLRNESSQTLLLENQCGVDEKTFNLLKKHYPFKKEVDAVIVSITTLHGPRSVSQKVHNNSFPLSRLGEKYIWSNQTRNGPDSHHACLWVHIPSNDRSWADFIIAKVHNLRTPSIPLEIKSYDCWKASERKHTYAEGFTFRYMNPSCSIMRPSNQGPPQLVLHMPYLHWSKSEDQVERSEALERFSKDRVLQNIYKQTRRNGSNFLSTASLGDCQDDLTDLHYHPRRTLDQYWYRSIDTKARDKDQIIYHETDPKKVLMVDQLWIYVTSPDTMVTFFPENDQTDPNSVYRFADLKTEIMQGLEGLKKSNTGSYVFTDAFDMTAYCLYHAVTVLLAHRHSDGYLAVMRVFRDTLERSYDNAVRSFDEFIANPDDNLEVNEDLKILRKVADLADELRIMHHLFEEQLEVITKFTEQVKALPRDSIANENTISLAKLALNELEKYQAEVIVYDRESHAIRAYVNNLMDLKQKGAGLNVAHSSAEQGRIMMIFTVFTIVFLPLSFFAGIYGMNVREWSGTATNPSAKTALMYMVPISVVLISLALLIAFFGKIRRLSRAVWNLFSGNKRQKEFKYTRLLGDVRLEGLRSLEDMGPITRHSGDGIV